MAETRYRNALAVTCNVRPYLYVGIVIFSWEETCNYCVFLRAISASGRVYVSFKALGEREPI